MVSNKRRFKRYNKRLQTSYTDGAEHFTGFSADISEQGLFIAARRIFSPGTDISMRLTLPDGSHAGAKGIVRRAIKGMNQISRGGMGVEIISYDDNFYDFLKSVITDFMGTDLTKRISGPFYKPPAPENHAPSAATESAAASDTQVSPVEQDTSNAASAAPASAQEDTRILVCIQCGAKNKVPISRIALGPKCGRCKAELSDNEIRKAEPAPSASSEHPGAAMNRPEAGSAEPNTDFGATHEEFTTIACASCGAKNKVQVSKLVLAPRCGRCREPLF